MGGCFSEDFCLFVCWLVGNVGILGYKIVEILAGHNEKMVGIPPPPKKKKKTRRLNVDILLITFWYKGQVICFFGPVIPRTFESPF